jgi:hypothetical protein
MATLSGIRSAGTYETATTGRDRATTNAKGLAALLTH